MFIFSTDSALYKATCDARSLTKVCWNRFAMSNSWMEIEEPGARDKQLDLIIEILNTEQEWSLDSQKALSTILSKSSTNRIQLQVLDAIRKATSDIRISTKLFENLTKANIIETFVQFLLEDAVNTSEMSSSILVNLSIYNIGLLGMD